MLHAIIQSVLWFFETKIRHLWCLQKYLKIGNGYIGSRCVNTHLSWLVYLSSVQASLTSDIYPTHYGCKCILLPIIFKWLQPMADDHRNQPKGWTHWMVFDRCVIIYTSTVYAFGGYVKNISYEYTLCVVSWILATGYVHLKQFGEHLKTIWCVIAARSRYGIGRDDDESKLA